ncbi:MAG: hypothetical protein ACKVQR_07185 [Aquabacterium sp.]
MAATRVWGATFLWLVVSMLPAVTAAQATNLAPGFSALPADAKILIAPLDVELFSLSAGGVTEPRADWTASALKHMQQALAGRKQALGLSSTELSAAKAEEQAELLNLHAAVARAISIHHRGVFKLPTKEDKLDWSFGDVLRPLRDASGARYGLFTWVRDSYASAERKAMMIGLALLGVGVAGGQQVGYATLVDLETGQVLWFNQLQRLSGDLREAEPAKESVATLLTGFPAPKKP